MLSSLPQLQCAGLHLELCQNELNALELRKILFGWIELYELNLFICLFTTPLFMCFVKYDTFFFSKIKDK